MINKFFSAKLFCRTYVLFSQRSQTYTYKLFSRYICEKICYWLPIIKTVEMQKCKIFFKNILLKMIHNIGSDERT